MGNPSLTSYFLFLVSNFLFLALTNQADTAATVPPARRWE